MNDLRLGPFPDPLARLPELAVRLGVKQFVERPGYASVILTTQTGERYDLFDLINAILDHVEMNTQ